MIIKYFNEVGIMNKKQDRVVRLNIEISEKMKYKLKEYAANRGVTMRDYVIGILANMINFEDKSK